MSIEFTELELDLIWDLVRAKQDNGSYIGNEKVYKRRLLSILTKIIEKENEN